MKFVSTVELCNNISSKLARKEDLILTAKGKPIAIVLWVNEEDLEETAHAVRQVKSQRAHSRMLREVLRRNLVRSWPSLINTQIRAVRSGRRSL